MSKIWIENGVVLCCSEVCNNVDKNSVCPRYDICVDIESPLKLKEDKDKLIELIRSVQFHCMEYLKCTEE